jgi:hypothetical protein
LKTGRLEAGELSSPITYCIISLYSINVKMLDGKELPGLSGRLIVDDCGGQVQSFIYNYNAKHHYPIYHPGFIDGRHILCPEAQLCRPGRVPRAGFPEAVLRLAGYQQILPAV